MGRPLKTSIQALLRRPLDRLFAVSANVPVLRALGGMNRGTGRAVARQAGIGAPAAHQALSRLEEMGLVRRSPAGRAFVFELNRKHYLYRQVLRPMLEAESALKDELGKILVQASGVKPLSGVIFGSVARGEEGPESDLDVCLVVADQAEKAKVEESMSGAFGRIWEEFGFKLSALVYSRTEFEKGYRSGKGFFVNAAEEGEVFAGVDLKEVIGGAEDSKAADGTRRSRKLRRRGT